MKEVSYIQRNPMAPKDAWDSLSIADKAAMMRVAVQNGITNLDDIRAKYNEFAEGGDENNLTPWKALGNIDYVTIPDTTFTREKTGAGSIEVMFKDTPKEGYEYGTGYKYPHPMPGHNVVIYNPKENDPQDIRLDALHIMPQDATYDALRSELAYYADGSDIANNAKDRMKEDIAKYGHTVSESYQDYYNNEIDGFLRNMFIEGTPEYIKTKRYYPNKKQLREWNKEMMPYVDRIHNYLITGNKPANVFPEIIVTGKKKSLGGNLYDGTSKPSNKMRKSGATGNTLKSTFLDTLNQSLKEDNRFDSSEFRRLFTELADMESSYRPTITNSIGAKGYFQLMPSNRSSSWSSPTQQFHDMYKLVGSNLDYLNKNLTKEDWKRAEELGIDKYGLLAGAHLGGVGNVVKALRGRGNAKDMNGSSVMGYMTKFSQGHSYTPTVEQPVSTAVVNPLLPFYQNTTVLPQVTPVEDNFVEVQEITPEQRRAEQVKNTFDAINNYNMMMDMLSVPNNPQPMYVPKNAPYVVRGFGGPIVEAAMNEYKKGGGIHIKHPGRLTALKKRTGKTEAELYNDGNPAHKKMVVFARNARKFKHGLGGNLYPIGGYIDYAANNSVQDTGAQNYTPGALETVNNVLSYMPITGTVMDIGEFVKNPTWENFGWAAASLGSDMLGASILKGTKAATAEYKAAKQVEKAAEEALDAHKKTFKHVSSRSLREEEKRLTKQLEDARWNSAVKTPFWDKVIEYPVFGGWLGVDAGMNAMQHNNKAFGGNLYGLGDYLRNSWNKLTQSAASTVKTAPVKKRYRSLTGNIFDTKNEAVLDNRAALRKEGKYADKDIMYEVVGGDSLWKIAKENNTDVDTLKRLNPSIKGDLIHVGDKINIGKQSTPSLYDIRKEWAKEKELNTDNLKAIQGVKHSDNYVVVDKLNSTLSVFDKDNNLLYQTSDVSTGKSGNDYNTITYVDEDGKIKSGKGNESTPAGITKITGTGTYHGYKSFTRGRGIGDNIEDIASSLHFGSTEDKKASNGCVRLPGNVLENLSEFIGVGTDVYTLPEKAGSRFVVKDGKLNFTADNPYGTNTGKEKYWDDYNVHIDKSYSPLKIVSKSKGSNEEYERNRQAYLDAIMNSKERLQSKFNLDSDTYNRLAALSVGIAEQESKFGTSRRKAIKDMTPDFVLDTLRGNSNRSRGITQIKMKGDNKEMQDVYSSLGISESNIDNPDVSGIATMARLASMYNNEVRGRSFYGENETPVDPYDALLYKWMGRNAELTNRTATPEQNEYINNVKKYQNNYDMYSIRGLGGNLFSGEEEGSQQMQIGLPSFTQMGQRDFFSELSEFNKQKEAVRQQQLAAIKKRVATKGRAEAERRAKDYLTTSNVSTAVNNGRPQNQHLEDRALKGAEAHAAWEKEHPNLTAWGNLVGAVPFAVAAYPLAATAGSGIVALGDAVAATSTGQAITAGLAPFATAASTNVAGAPLYTWADVGLSSLFGGHGIQTAIDERGISPMTTLEVTPLGRLARPMWNAGKEGLQYTAKVADNAARYASPSYDLYRTIGETTPRTTPTYRGFSLNEVQAYTGSPIFELGQTIGTSPEKAYFMRAPKNIDILKLGNGRFRHEVTSNEILPSGEVNGKFVSYGEPWREFALGENSALYEFPVGPRRGSSLMATDWKGRPQEFSVDEIYDYMQKRRALDREFRKYVDSGGEGGIEAYSALEKEKYPELLEYYDTSMYGANQTVIPNERWNFDKFLKTPFWKYSQNPISGQVQKELMMRWPEAKPLETSTIEWTDAARTPQITEENAASITPKVNWDADNWFKTISGRGSYSSEEAAELASHVPEYRAIEQRLFNEGKLTYDSNGNIIVKGSDMSPQEYIMRQSTAFQKMNPEHHYVGVSKGLRHNFENEARDPNTRNRYEVWTDRKSPKNVEEYAQSQQGGYTNDSQIETIEHQMAIREENHDLHKEQLKWKLDHGKIPQENYDRDLAALEDMYNWKQKVAEDELKVLRQQKALDPLNGGKVFDVTYPKETAETPIINAENSHWASIPFDNVVRDAPSVITHYKQRPYSNELQTDQIVSAARRNGYGVTHIDNVMDTYDGTMLNETIIGRDTPIKSVLGNTGNFDIESPNKWRLYRSLLPPFLSLGTLGSLYGTSNR